MRPHSSSQKSTHTHVDMSNNRCLHSMSLWIVCPSLFSHQVRQQAESLHETQRAAPHVSSSQPSPPQPGVWSAAPDVSRAQQNVPLVLKLGTLNAKRWLRPPLFCVRQAQTEASGWRLRSRGDERHHRLPLRTRWLFFGGRYSPDRT